jgi:hypothetical protein
MMFHKRLSGEPIGLSVMGIFVITKTTILSVRNILLYLRNVAPSTFVVIES